MLSIVVNLLILILRISAHELQTNGTLATATHRFEIKTTVEKTSETGEYSFCEASLSFVSGKMLSHTLNIHCIIFVVWCLFAN